MASLGPAQVVQDGDWSERLRRAAAKLASAPSHANAHEAYRAGMEAPATVEGFAPLNCGILRNVTVEPWLPELYGALLQRGIKTTFLVGDYAVYEPYASAPADLGTPMPDCFLVYLDAGVLAGDARHDPPADMGGALLGRIRAIVGGLIERTSANVVVTNLAPEPHPVHSVHGDQDRKGWPHLRRTVNAELTAALSEEPRVSILDMDRIVGEFGASRAYDMRMYMTAASPFAVEFLPQLGRAFAATVAAAVLPPRKCVVVDCDNTLWGGILGEDGPEGVAIGTNYPGSAYREFQLFLAGLARRGFLLALNSKNNEGDVLSFMEECPEMVLGPADFAAWRINWEDKAANLAELAQDLNIGLDSMVFIDDSPFECERVKSALPEVQVERFPANPLEVPRYLSAIQGVERLGVGSDDLARTESIRANARRERLRRETPDLGSFLRSLSIKLTIARQDRTAVRRISELCQRTNQFNLTTKRYSVGDIERLMDEGAVYTMSMKDRFSDYGTIGVAIVDTGSGDRWEIDSFMLSCRAFGRGVEVELLKAVLEDAGTAGVRSVGARHVATAKNGMTRNFFPDHGFAETEGPNGEVRFEMRIGAADGRRTAGVGEVRRVESPT
ncbi:MAG: HAD-IIIC family phosphatase [Gemmatimonadetes bacterium]|nr:HAD-IIIC family phosphatase [Gemmatimonadota bacterium]